MGQYHKVYNLDKKEFLHPHRMNEGLKLREWNRGNVAAGLALLLCNCNGRGGGDYNSENDALAEVAGRWAGDRIVVQGDYAENGDPAFIDENFLDSYKDISALVMQAIADDL